ncbi:4-phosphopantetheinyl transferase [Pantoea graminicola]|uniref:4'-phosphopantetheinyl transferase family protein n=1 Tax=Pantoea sp. ARC607 TaxID=2027922 RepID=UPI000DA82CD9|nr:4'-phosphopantetheinyl transferase superfamily protein [Pantoea sp. ARC607]PZL97986.1 4-phosphopantetheinyl transferase [Pantoea sp. ARC607]
MHFPDQPLPPVSGGFILSRLLHRGDPLLAVCYFDPQHYHDALAEEWGLTLPERLQRAVVKRRAEYLASRLLVRAVMAEFGIVDFILNSAPDRSPRWPAGIQASLSHTTGTVVVVATRQNLAIGVDVEQWMSETTARETAAYLMNAQEQQLLHTLPVPFHAAATLLFSLKESLYKALWPQLHQPMDFTDAALEAVDWTQGRATLRLTQTFSTGFPAGTLLQASFLWQADQVMTQVTHSL